jgi:hypothetical protein
MGAEDMTSRKYVLHPVGVAHTDPDLKSALGHSLYDLAINLDYPNPKFLRRRFAQSEAMAAAAANDPAAVLPGRMPPAVEIAWDAVAIEMKAAIEGGNKVYSHEEALEVVKRHTRLAQDATSAAAA